MTRKMLMGMVIGLGGLLTAQVHQAKPAHREDVLIFNQGIGPAGQTRGMVMHFGSLQQKGAPYAAEAVTEMVQTLPDGNRIQHRTVTKTYRDSEGRTRMESPFAPVGNWVPSDPTGTLITIQDPVKGEHVTLNTQQKTAYRHKLPEAAAGPAGEGVKVERTMEVKELVGGPPAGTQGADTMIFIQNAPGMAMSRRVLNSGDMKVEELGQQTIEGVNCVGVRETFTTPAGAIGNERAIVSSTERWTSPELGIEILRKHSDPRSGEITYRVTMLQRGEQPISLFEIPADYKVEEGIPSFRFERKIEHKPKQ